MVDDMDLSEVWLTKDIALFHDVILGTAGEATHGAGF